MAQLYLVNVRDELALPGHVDLLIVGPHLALNSKKQHFQVPLLSKPKYRGKEKNIYICCSFKGRNSFAFGEKNLSDSHTILKPIYLWSDLCGTHVRENTVH